jgi:hypothetical protein
MIDATFSDLTQRVIEAIPGQIAQKDYYYHDIRIICHTNHPILRATLEDIFGMFPEPAEVRGEATYVLFCYERATQFPMPLPSICIEIGILSLPSNTRLKYYRSHDPTRNYLYFVAHSSVNGNALSIIQKEQHSALTQLEQPEDYDLTFLRRYIVLLTLGELLASFGFEPCHAAAITVPGNDQQGALILGESGSGKTTLSLGCACLGYGFLGDDLVMLRQEDSNKPVNAYALLSEVSVRSGTLDLWPQLSFLRAYPADSRDKRSSTIEEIRAGATRLCVPVHLLLFPALTTAQSSIITPLKKAATLQALIHYCFSKDMMHSTSQKRLFTLLAALVEQTQGYHLAIAHGDAAMPQRLYTLFAEIAT